MTLQTRAYRSWRASLLLAAGVLMLAGCGHAETSSAGAMATATATPAPINLTWQVASSPSGAFPTPSAYAVAPSDGRVTYACGYTSQQMITGARVWSTDDRGRTWSRGVALPYSRMLSECVIVVDANDSQRVSVWLNTAKMGASPDMGNVVSYLSQDGGATWRALPKVGPYIMLSMASSRSAIYASGSGLSASGAYLRDVWVSHDGGVSWRALGASSLADNPRIWVNPQTGSLLGTDGNYPTPTLWSSDNGGASWRKISIPTVVGASGQQTFNVQTFIVALNGAGWRICATGTTGSGPNQASALACSADLGATWVSPMGLTLTQQSPKGFIFTVPGDIFAIMDDGSLLASYTDNRLLQHVEALAPGASAWAPVSDPPVASSTGGDPVSTAGPGGGMLWVPGGDGAHPFATAVYP